MPPNHPSTGLRLWVTDASYRCLILPSTPDAADEGSAVSIQVDKYWNDFYASEEVLDFKMHVLGAHQFCCPRLHIHPRVKMQRMMWNASVSCCVSILCTFHPSAHSLTLGSSQASPECVCRCCRIGIALSAIHALISPFLARLTYICMFERFVRFSCDGPTQSDRVTDARVSLVEC